MTSPTDFTQEEWKIIEDAPFYVGTAVALVADSGFFGTGKEILDMSLEVVRVSEDYADNELIKALVESDEEEAKKKRARIKQQGEEIDSLEEMVDFTVDQLRQALDFLSKKATPKEMGEYKQLVHRIGDKVANSAKEGGFFGIGGERLSEAEKQVLSKVAAVLDSSG